MGRKKSGALPPEMRAQVRAARGPAASRVQTLERGGSPAVLQWGVSIGDLVKPRGHSVGPDGVPLVGIVLEVTQRSACVLWGFGAREWWSMTILRSVGLRSLGDEEDEDT